VLKALADETRIRILNLLYNGELCVCELEVLLNINQSNASRHLNKLSNANILIYEKRAQYVYYRINKDIFDKYPFLSNLLKDGLGEIKQCQVDRERLERYKKSGITCDELKEGKLIF
jgi:ArsR family transcriptional regulator